MPFCPGAGAQGDRQDTFNRTHSARQREFTHHDKIFQLFGLNCPLAASIPTAIGKSKLGPSFLYVGRREIDRRAAHGEFERGIGDRSADPIPGLFHRGVRQTDNDDEGIAPTGIDLDLDRVSLNTIDSSRTNLG